MSKIGIVTATLYVLLFSSSAQAGEIRKVRPTGVYPDDVANVQAVVDELGESGQDAIIVLKAHNKDNIPTAFNFGTSTDATARGGIIVRAEHHGSVEFRGEKTRRAMTTIEGGFSPIQMLRADRIAVRKIRFQGAQESAIAIDFATGITITDNAIIETERGSQFSPIGIDIGPLLTFDFANPPVSGPIRIERNLIDTFITNRFNFGISITNTDSKVTIRDNDIRNVGTGITVNIFRRPFRVINNRFKLLPLVEEGPPLGFTSGVGVFCGLGRKARVVISRNAIKSTRSDFVSGMIVGGTASTSYDPTLAEPIPCPVKDTVIFRNSIEMLGEVPSTPASRIGIDILAIDGRVFRSTIFGNDISGTSNYGISLNGFTISGAFDSEIYDNKIFGNELNLLDVTNSRVLLGSITRDNLVFVDEEDSVEDLGTNNRVVRQ